MNETEYVFRPPGQPIKTKCAVLGCDNRMGGGLFHGFLCAPCHGFISTGEGVYSQAYRNMQTTIDAEREACVEIIQSYRISVGNSAVGEMEAEWTYAALKEIREEIKARGKA